MINPQIQEKILIETQYLPCIEYFVVVHSFNQIVWECHEHYPKQTYRNRCRIMTANGPLELSVPVQRGASKIKTRDVKIDYRQKWVNLHWRSIKSAYGKAPFYQFFGPMIKSVYDKQHTYLLDLNMDFFLLCQKLLSYSSGLKKNTHYQHELAADFQDWRSKIHPKKARENNPIYKPCNYNQIFGKKFVGNLSIIDLLFCEGPGANSILQKSRR